MSTSRKKIVYYVFDTNVFISCPETLQSLLPGEKVLIPIEVMEELDKKKNDFNKEQKKEERHKMNESLKFIAEHPDFFDKGFSDQKEIQDNLEKNKYDNLILSATLASLKDHETILVTNDRNLAAKAALEKCPVIIGDNFQNRPFAIKKRRKEEEERWKEEEERRKEEEKRRKEEEERWKEEEERRKEEEERRLKEEEERRKEEEIKHNNIASAILGAVVLLFYSITFFCCFDRRHADSIFDFEHPLYFFFLSILFAVILFVPSLGDSSPNKGAMTYLNIVLGIIILLFALIVFCYAGYWWLFLLMIILIVIIAIHEN